MTQSFHLANHFLGFRGIFLEREKKAVPQMLFFERQKFLLLFFEIRFAALTTLNNTSF